MTDFRINGSNIQTNADALEVDHIAEKTATHGVAIDGITLKDDLNTSGIVDKTTGQTLTNKTLTAPVINNSTGDIPTLKTALKANEIIIMAAGFKIAGSSATLESTDGTAAKCYVEHVSAEKTYWFDLPKFPVPADYDGGAIDISITFKSADSAKTHSMGIRVASVATGSPCNPDLAAAYQLYNAEASDATAGDIKVKTVTVAQANHLMVAGQDWHCKFVVEDDGECDADAVLIEKVRIKWNKV